MTKATIEPVATAWLWEKTGTIINLSEFMELADGAKLVEDGALVPLYKLVQGSDALSPVSPQEWEDLAVTSGVLDSLKMKLEPGTDVEIVLSDLMTFGKKVAQEIQTRTNVFVELSSVEVRGIYETLCNTAGFNYQRMAKAVEHAVHEKRLHSVARMTSPSQPLTN